MHTAFGIGTVDIIFYLEYASHFNASDLRTTTKIAIQLRNREFFIQHKMPLLQSSNHHVLYVSFCYCAELLIRPEQFLMYGEKYMWILRKCYKTHIIYPVHTILFEFSRILQRNFCSTNMAITTRYDLASIQFYRGLFFRNFPFM